MCRNEPQDLQVNNLPSLPVGFMSFFGLCFWLLIDGCRNPCVLVLSNVLPRPGLPQDAVYHIARNLQLAKPLHSQQEKQVLILYLVLPTG